MRPELAESGYIMVTGRFSYLPMDMHFAGYELKLRGRQYARMMDRAVS